MLGNLNNEKRERERDMNGSQRLGTETEPEQYREWWVLMAYSHMTATRVLEWQTSPPVPSIHHDHQQSPYIQD